MALGSSRYASLQRAFVGRFVILALISTGCVISVEPPPSAVLTCSSDADCPGGSRCVDGIDACLVPDNDQQGATVLSVVVEPQVVGIDDEVTLSVVVSEPLFRSPTVLLPDGSPAEFVPPATDNQYTYRYRTAPDDAPSVSLTIDMYDSSGNRTTEPLTSIAIDTEPPVLTNLQWTDAISSPTGSSRLSFSGEASVDALVSAELVDPDGMVLADVFVGSTPTGSGLVLTGAVELGEVALPSLAAAGSVAIRVTAADPVGNTRSETLPLRALDAVAPETELTETPGLAPITRDVTFRFTSSSADLAGFECRLAPDDFVPCTSPWQPVLPSSGPLTAEIRAVDENGNADLTPATHVFEVVAIWESVDVTDRIACGISTDERLWCWGRGSVATGYTASKASSPTLISDERAWKKVFVGDNMVCAKDDADDLYCWGEGPLGLGEGDEVAYSRPVLLPSGPWQSIAMGLFDRCAIRMDGTLWCWGSGEAAGTSRGSDVPLQIGSASDWTSVDVGGFGGAACGLRGVGPGKSAWCWGDNRDRELGDGTTTDRVDPVEVSVDGVGPVADWLLISAGDNYACGIRGVTSAAGTLWCWGANVGGVLGLPYDSNPPDQDVVQIGSGTDWVSVSAGKDRTCGLRAGGAAYCWGGRQGDAQIPTLEGFRIPAPDAPLALNNPEPWVSVSAGREYACGLNADGGLTCLGDNTDGLLGGGVDSSEQVPLTPLAGPADWSRVDMDGFPAVGCGLAAGGLYCWGRSGTLFGDPGTDGTIDLDSSAPLRVGIEDDWVELSRGSGATCGIREGASGDRTGWCLGTRPLGVAGDPPPTTVPLQVGTGGDLETTWQAIDVQWDWALGILERIPGERTLWQWGEPGYFTGDPDDAFIELPAQLGSATDWLTVDNGGGFGCGIRAQVTGNSLWCWGSASSLELAVADSETPQQIGVGQPYELGWLSVHGRCGIRNDGTRNSLWCWGDQDDLIGEGDDLVEPTEIPAPELQSFVRGEEGGCGLDLAGGLWCAGRVQGVVFAGPVFTPITPGTVWQSLMFDEDTLCGIDDSGIGYCAGRNNRGQRGTGESWGPFFPGVPR